MTERGEVRASDKDRDEVAASLGAHWTDGRLNEEELDRRVAAAYAATTRGELDELVRDLPSGSPPPAPDSSGRRSFLPGIVYFKEQVELGAARERAFDQALASIVPALGASGYHLVESQRPERMRFEKAKGLIFRRQLPLTMLFLSASPGSRIVAFGEASRAVRKAFAELRD